MGSRPWLLPEGKTYPTLLALRIICALRRPIWVTTLATRLHLIHHISTPSGFQPILRCRCLLALTNPRTVL